MSLVPIRICLHHPHTALTAWREASTARKALEPGRLPAALGLDADVLHDGGAMFGLEHPLIRLEARCAGLPEGWQWTEEAAPPLPDARPWQQPGFFARTWPRLRSRQPDGPARLISTNDLNVVLAAGEGEQQVFLKMGRRRADDGSLQVGQEARVTAALARSQPGLVPEVVSADPRSGELMTRWAGQTLDRVDGWRGWAAAAAALAAYHRSAGVEGVVHHPFGAVLERGEALLRDESALCGWGMNPTQIGALADTVPELRRRWRAVDALGLPDGPVHGDSHPMNALWNGETARWFDWSEAATGHPFLDVGWLLGHSARRHWPIHEAVPDLGPKLAETYLHALGLPTATSELHAALALTFLHRAVVYDDTFRHWPAPRPQYVPMFLRLLLAEQPSQTGALDSFA